MQVTNLLNWVMALNNEIKPLVDTLDNLIIIVDDDYQLIYSNRSGTEFLKNYSITELKNNIEKSEYINDQIIRILDNGLDKIIIRKIFTDCNLLEGYLIISNDRHELLSLINSNDINQKVHQMKILE